MARTKCLTSQRDQASMLDAWLRFHAYLVGLRNLVVHDEGSTDPETLASLRRAELAGADIRRHGGGTGLHAHARSLAAESADADIVVPLATDEFLAVYTSDGVSCRCDHLHAALDTLRCERRMLAGAPALSSVAGRAGEFSLAASPGPALPGGSRVEGERATPLTCLRFADQSAPLSEARILFQGFGQLIEALGIGHERFGAPMRGLRAAAADAVWVRTGPDENAVRFVGGDNRRAHDDPAESGWPPLPHYALAGLGERRHPG